MSHDDNGPALLGAHLDDTGAGFGVFSSVAERIELLLYSPEGKHQASVDLERDTGPLWRTFVPGVTAGMLYGYRVHGPFDPAAGHRCNPAKVLFDPYARAVGRPLFWQPGLPVGAADPLHGGAFEADPRDTAASAPLAMVTGGDFDWQGVTRPRPGPGERVIYETHVRGMTMRHPGVPAELRGTYLGLCHPAVLEHLRDLGVTSVQLMPVHAFVNDERLFRNGLRQYWGYNTLGFFAPEPRYALRPGDARDEFRTMVRELHRAGLEVILDVVYNHTAEGNEYGPTLSFRGFDNSAWYRLDRSDRGRYSDFTGTGNTLDLRRPFALQLVLDSLRHWVGEMGVDGFRFDLATALGRGRGDQFDADGAFFQAVQQDPLLAGVALFAEPWDPGPDGYHPGGFPWRWAEHNGPYRDVVRTLWRGAPGVHDVVATRLSGSSDLFRPGGRRPVHSVNFVTVHDGFTLTDLVSYERKHNHANLEGNRDGSDHNQSQNCGVEGTTDDPAVLALRDRLRRGMLATLFVSQGTPLLLGGDELGRTQLGNNNAYCQDNEVSWFDWELDARGEEFLQYVRSLTALRREYPQLRRTSWLTGRDGGNGDRDVIWFNADGGEMTREDWESAERTVLCMRLAGVDAAGPGARTLLVVVHAAEDRELRLPPGEWEYVFGSAGPDALFGPLEGGGIVLATGNALTVLALRNAG